MNIFKKKCDGCKIIETMIDDRKINLNSIQKLVKENKLDLYASNCKANEIDYWINKGNHYTINTYYKCNECERYYFVGFCLYGTPIIKELSKDDVIDGALRIEWGFDGTYFQNGVSLPDIKTIYSKANRSELYGPAWKSLIETYNYGTATPMNALISVIKVFYKRVCNGGFLNIHFKENGMTKTLNKSSFDEIIKFYFGEIVLIESKK